jgi:hypothetical protein
LPYVLSSGAYSLHFFINLRASIEYNFLFVNSISLYSFQEVQINGINLRVWHHELLPS